MKIWLQSSTGIGNGSLWSDYQESIERHVNEVARPDTVVEIHGVDVVAPDLESYHYFESLNNRQIIENAVYAEKQGYDVFALICMIDPAYYELHEVVNIPVIFAAETCWHLACVLADKFSLLAYNPMLIRNNEKLIKRYGLWDHYVPVSSFSMDIVELQRGFRDPRPVIEPLTKEAERAAVAGAGMFVSTCQCLNMILTDNGVRNIAGVPVMDNAAVVVKMAELMVDLKKWGISLSRTTFLAPPPTQLDEVRKLFGVAK